MGSLPYRCPPQARPTLVAMESIERELDEAQSAHRAHLGALREMLAEHSPAEGDNLDANTSERMRSAVSNILRLQRIITRLEQ